MRLKCPIIGITGRAGAGKDTVSDYIRAIGSAQQKDVAKIACADYLKEICATIFGRAFDIPNMAFYGTQTDKEAPLEAVPGWTGRRILQFVGTECFRSIHEDIWSREMIGRALREINQNNKDLVVVSDVRFLSEAIVIRKAGGIVVRVKRPEADALPAVHASETQLALIKEDYVIDNQGRELYLLENLVKDFLCRLNF